MKRRESWDSIKYDVFLQQSQVILGRDLKFTISPREVWGHQARLDPLHPYLINLFKEVGLINVETMNLGPTWSSGKEGVDGIVKHLDRFLLSEELISSVHRFWSWVVPSFFFDHMPMVL